MSNATDEWIDVELCDKRYRVIRKLGEGGMSVVYLARDNRLGADVVVKVPRRAIQEDPQFSGRFQREVRSLVALSHPNICKVLDVGELNGRPFAIMQYLDGGDVDSHRPNDATGAFTPMSVDDVLKWLEKIAEALDFVHKRGFVHRDVKPSNIMFDEHHHPYLADFGVVKVVADERATMMQMGATNAGMVVGTPDYMAPELIMGNDCDGRIDQYALAITVHELLVGQPPFHGASGAVLVQQTTKAPPKLSDLNQEVPDAAGDVILKALSKDAQDRYPTCLEFAQAFREACRPMQSSRDTGGRPAGAQTVTMHADDAAVAPAPRASKLPLIAGAAVVGVLAIVGLLSAAYYFNDGSVVGETTGDETTSSTTGDTETGAVDPNAPDPSLYAVIELSPGGVRAVVIPIHDEAANILDRRFRSLELSALTEPTLTKELTKQTVSAAKTHITWLTSENRVPPDHILLVCQSGVAESEALTELFQQLETEVGVPVEHVSLTDEVKLLVDGVIPEEKLNSAAVIDVGGDALRCGYRIVGSGALVTSDEVVLTPVPGPKSYFMEAQQKADADGIPLAEASAALRIEKIVSPLRVRIRAGLRNRQEIYLSGDTAWAMVTILRPETAEQAEVDLPFSAIGEFRQLLIDRGADVFNPADKPNLSERAMQDIDRIRNTFSVDELIAGADVLLGVAQAFRLDEEGRVIHFSRKGSRAWLIGYAKQHANP